MADETSDRIAALERQIVELQNPPPPPPSPAALRLPSPGAKQWRDDVEAAQKRAREARVAADKKASAERREQAERDLPELLEWHARLQAVDDQIAAVRAERAALGERETALGWERTRINGERPLSPEAAMLLNETLQGRAG